MRKLVLFTVVLVHPVLGIEALDPDFFGVENRASQGETLSHDFFRSKKGLIQNADEGEYGCTNISSSSAASEANRIGQTAQKYCQDQPSIRFIPTNIDDTPTNRLAPNQSQRGTVSGYYLVCCRKRQSRRHRRHQR